MEHKYKYSYILEMKNEIWCKMFRVSQFLEDLE